MRFRGIVASGMTAAVLAFGPTQSAFAEGFHFAVFGGLSSPDLSKSDYDQFYTDVVDLAGGTVLGIDSTLDDTGNSWGVQIGYSWNSYIAMEVGYTNLGQALYEADIDAAPFGVFASTRYLSSGPTVAVLGMLPLNGKFSLHGRAGVYFSDTRIRFKIEDDAIELKGSDKDFLVGVGGSWNFNDSYALRLEYQRFLDVGNENQTGEADVDLIAVSFLFK